MEGLAAAEDFFSGRAVGDASQGPATEDDSPDSAPKIAVKKNAKREDVSDCRQG